MSYQSINSGSLAIQRMSDNQWSGDALCHLTGFDYYTPRATDSKENVRNIQKWNIHYWFFQKKKITEYSIFGPATYHRFHRILDGSYYKMFFFLS